MNNSRDIDFILKFGKNLRRIRKNNNMSQETLAIKAETSRSQIARIERGEINPTITTVKRIAEVLQIEIQVLFLFE